WKKQVLTGPFAAMPHLWQKLWVWIRESLPGLKNSRKRGIDPMGNQLLQLDQEKVDQARQLAHAVALNVQEDIQRHTTVTIERTVARLFGIDGTDRNDVPLANVLVDQVDQAGFLNRGIAFWLANAVVALNMTPQQVAQGCASDLRICELPLQDPGRIAEIKTAYTEEALIAIRQQ
ncbi:MAG TPA: hypothetical protein DDW87_04605, partial [Firmicutes bacterium]|nr:hypothetical protein [Bacillota bacterium]